MRLRAPAYACVVLAVVLAIGCASSRRGPQVRLEDPGHPAKQSDGPRSDAGDGLEGYIERVTARQAVARPAVKLQATSVEQMDPVLGAALAAVHAQPTAARHRAVADAYRRVQIDDKAYDHFRAAVKLDPRDALAWDGLARLWRDWGFPQRGVGDAARAVYHAPSVAGIVNTQGTIFYRLRRFEAARASFARAVALEPHASWALRNLCAATWAAADHAAAADACSRALVADTSLREPREILARLGVAVPATPSTAEREAVRTHRAEMISLPSLEPSLSSVRLAPREERR